MDEASTSNASTGFRGAVFAVTKPLATPELRAALESRLAAFSKSGIRDWRVFEEPGTRDIELDRRPLALLGAGAVAAADFAAHAVENFNVVALVDNLRAGQSLFGHPCGSDDEFRAAAKKEPALVAILCCAGDGAVRHFAELAAEVGVPILSLYQARRRVGSIGFGEAHGVPETVERLAYANPFLDRFADETSLRTYFSLLLHRLSWSRHWLDPIRLPYGDMYFGTDVFSVSQAEILVDGGAFDGDTIREFDRFSHRHARRIYAFEPDARNIAALRTAMAGRDEITIVESGLWSKTTTLAFRAEGTLASGFDQDGTVPVSVVALDDCVGDATLIKLDIESAEIPALLGGKNLIAQKQPKLAIAAYHLPDDLIEIPRTVLDLNPDYRLFLRHHSPWLTDTVILAVAP